jgi:5-methylcytosine-specific restriction protein A
MGDLFRTTLSLLKEVASRIKSIGQNETLRNKIKYIEIDETEEAKEGKTLLKLHKYRERNQSIVKKKKAFVLQQTGSLICETCGFDFEKSYGGYGRGYIECHHKVPLHELLPNRKTTLKDLSLICANCHRIIHRIKPMPSIKKFKNMSSRYLKLIH